jgi:hypothetical protein
VDIDVSEDQANFIFKFGVYKLRNRFNVYRHGARSVDTETQGRGKKEEPRSRPKSEQSMMGKPQNLIILGYLVVIVLSLLYLVVWPMPGHGTGMCEHWGCQTHEGW